LTRRNAPEIPEIQLFRKSTELDTLDLDL